jgi:hypothetical protein
VGTIEKLDPERQSLSAHQTAEPEPALAVIALLADQ